MGDSKTSEDSTVKALDLMVAANWLTRYVQNANHGFALQWTKKGEAQISAIFATFQDLSMEQLDPEIWWSVLTIANQIFGRDGTGIRDFDNKEGSL